MHQLRKDIQEYLKVELDLELKGDYQVFPVDIRGIDFVGYRHFRHYVLLRKTTATNLKRKMAKLKNKLDRGGKMTYSEWCSVNSYRGWVIWCDGHNLTERYIKPLDEYYESYYLKNIKGKKPKEIAKLKEGG